MREQLLSQLRPDDRQMVERTMANHLLTAAETIDMLTEFGGL